MEAIAAASAILGIATAGVQCSIKLVTFASQVKSAEEEVTHIAEEVSLNASILQQLAELAKDGLENEQAPGNGTHGDLDIHDAKNDQSRRGIFNAAGLATVMNLAEKCKDIFDHLNESIQKASAQTSSDSEAPGQVKLTRFTMLKWPFLKPEMEALQAQLRDVKGTLMLMLQVAMLAYSRRMAKCESVTSLKSFPNLSISDQELLALSIASAYKKQNVRPSSRSTEINNAPKYDAQLSTPPKARETSSVNHRHPEKKPSRIFQFCRRFLHSKPNDVTADDASEKPPSIRDIHLEPSFAIDKATFQSSDMDQQSLASQSVSKSTRRYQSYTIPSVNEAKANVQYVSQPKGEATRPESYYGTGSPSPLQDFLGVLVFSPVACIKDRKIHVEYVHRIISISQEAAQLQLEEWKSTSNDSVLNQLLALTTSEHEALEASPFSSDGRSKLGDECLEWLHFGESLPLVDDVAHVRARTLTAVVKMSCRPQDKKQAGEVVKDEGERSNTWIKVHRTHLLPETLDQYKLHWVQDEHDSNYIVIKQWLSEDFQDELFAHTRRIHQANLVAPSPSMYLERPENIHVRTSNDLTTPEKKNKKKTQINAGDWESDRVDTPETALNAHSHADPRGDNVDTVVADLLARYTNS
ncbi:hypothetical protein P170DRAFT_477408 [Aspergillus steynii IBT 23096]|uniref:Fungal N-terminal domain-containing protein n=1 Tax=Aspergillus steynii IBT 23096 TaxID=1392250 RepID=A0A2I2G0X4_9EURO|nr:uncharacterized protein P170DRAFT_477408 [Aspergillus steynii IBT 23096]PLB46527.1 hypothetical protein P170DRAFT_477408 [Aspergillus steynii IBT 23096]